MQFIPGLSSTSINNKHLKTRATLRGWRRHHPARSTCDVALCLLSLGLSTTFAFHTTSRPQLLRPPGTVFTCVFTYVSKLQLYQLWQRCLSAYGSGWEHLWLMTRRRQSHPQFFWCFFSNSQPCCHFSYSMFVQCLWPRAHKLGEVSVLIHVFSVK